MDLDKEKIEPGVVFRAGSPVRADGTYICVPCGYKRTFKAGDTFTKCEACLKKGLYNEGADYISGLGLWEIIK